MKFGIFTDLHYSTKEIACSTRRPNKSLGKLKIAIDMMKEADAFICLGDLVDDCGDAGQNLNCINELISLIRGTGKAFYCIPGNHDCTNFTKDHFYGLAGVQKLPFMLEAENHRLLFLDACFGADGTEYEPGHVNWVDTDLDKNQIKWLEERLKDNSGKPYIIFIHQCLDPNVEYRHILHNAEEIRSMFESAGCVETVIEGHYHKGADNSVNGIRYFTLPAMCELDNIPYTVMDL